MAPDGATEDKVTLASTGQIYVTLAAVLEYHRAIGGAEAAQEINVERGLEQSRRELTVLLLGAHRRPTERDLERWRRRTHDLDVTALVTREDALAVVVGISVRVRPPRTDRS